MTPDCGEPPQSAAGLVSTGNANAASTPQSGLYHDTTPTQGVHPRPGNCRATAPDPLLRVEHTLSCIMSPLWRRGPGVASRV